MHATLTHLRIVPDVDHQGLASSLADIAGSPSGVCLTRLAGGGSGLFLAMWPDLAAAEAAAASLTRDQSAGASIVPVGATAVMAVEYVNRADSQEPARVMNVIAFDPHDQVWTEAFDRATHERVAPAALSVAGALDGWTLRNASEGTVVLTFATSVDVLAAEQDAISGTELLDWEDPATLGGPDRMETHDVLVARLPVAVTS